MPEEAAAAEETIPRAVEEPTSDSSDLPIRVAFGIGGLIVGAGAVLALRRPSPGALHRGPAPPPPPS